MKLWIPMVILLISVLGLCVWDSVHTKHVFNNLEKQSSVIYKTLLTTDISDKNIQKKIYELNNYWTDEMDTLCISISRKDLQPVSDYMQYLYTSIINKSQEDAITYSRLLNYNIIGLKEINNISFVNLL